MFEWLLIGGVLIGSLSPLLTFARLFQMKEWRLDRLKEHCRREGWIRTALRIFLQGLRGRQQFPVWTSKAILIVLTTVALTLISALALTNNRQALIIALFPIIILQPVFLVFAWLLWKPLDWLLKNRLLTNASIHRNTFDDATVIGIVGSVGKTTTKELMKCVLADFSPFVTPEHVNTELGVAAWIQKIPANAEKPFLIVEMGAYRRGEIATLCRIAQPTIAVITALGSDHLALFGSEEAIIEANAEILDSLPANGHLFLLGDNASAKSLKKRAHCPVTIAGSADATEIRETDRGLVFESQGARFNVALHGLHNAGNALLAIAVARALGVKDERIRELLAGFRGSSHTFHLKKERGVLVLDDTYNVSPLSFRAALDWAKKRPERPRVLLTSGLLETGTQEDDFMQVLGSAAKKSVERVVFTTESGKEAFSDAFGKPVESLSSAEAVSDDGLLLCVGRMPASAIQKLLPTDE